MKSEEFNIQPKAGILGVFSRLNYKPWYAIGEFVDNSTASYFGHKPSMKFYKIKKITVNIEYDSYENSLTITDDAYGMERRDFERAVLMDQKPDNLNGRNEFGMGLKTAASWFGNVWSVESTQLGSKVRYFAEVNIPKLREENLNCINIITSDADEKEHGTVVKIKQITKKIDASNTKKKIKDLLSSMYRRDINSGEVDIFFNGEKLVFEPYKILKFRNNEWEKTVDFTFNFNGKDYHVDGFVGIMQDGSFPKAGFSLFRFNRVIIGGFDENYKPNFIFGQAQSQISLKLYGEFNMDDFPVNQAKDGFVWDDGLEDEFLKKLKEEIKDYIEIASISKKDRAKEEEISEENSKNTQENVSNNFKNLILDDDIPSENEGEIDDKFTKNDNVSLYEKEQKEDNQLNADSISKPREYEIQLDPVSRKKFVVYWKITNDEKWIDYNSETSEIIININHPFFKPYSLEKDFKDVLESFVVSFVCAEELAKKASLQSGGPDNYILPSVFRNKMNLILKKLGEKSGR